MQIDVIHLLPSALGQSGWHLEPRGPSLPDLVAWNHLGDTASAALIDRDQDVHGFRRATRASALAPALIMCSCALADKWFPGRVAGNP